MTTQETTCIRIAGAAGQGLQTAAELLGRGLSRCGHAVYLYNDAESRIRGGLNFSHLRVGAPLRQGVLERIDLLVALTPEALSAFRGQLNLGAAVVCDRECSEPGRENLALAELAQAAGSPRTLAVVATGVVAASLGLPREVLEALLRDRFGKDETALAMNLRALDAGWKAGSAWPPAGRLHLPQAKPSAGRIWISGAEAVALGAVAGGVRFVAGYPMSPATGTLTALAEWAHEGGLVVEQAEDEVAAINMLAGASYAGARALTATSGGGFCLMTEGISLLGMIECGAVIVLGQRPGPATGLPTRTAQGDLRLVLHAGHGSFPRVVLAPRNVAEGFWLTARALDLAERYQVPVFVLTDQLLQESQVSLPAFTPEGLGHSRHLLGREALERLARYQRYELTDDGLSPQAAPGASRHVVVVDSDEHDSEGHLTERPLLAEAMARKRARKADTLAAALAFEPELLGDPQARNLVVSWGSSFETLREALANLEGKGLRAAHLHLSQLWPLPVARLEALLGRARRLVTVEMNTSAELGGLLAQVALRRPDVALQRWDGRPFTVPELEGRLMEVLR